MSYNARASAYSSSSCFGEALGGGTPETLDSRKSPQITIRGDFEALSLTYYVPTGGGGWCSLGDSAQGSGLSLRVMKLGKSFIFFTVAAVSTSDMNGKFTFVLSLNKMESHCFFSL